MRAMVLDRPQTPLVLRELPDPEPGPGEIVLRVTACAVCRTDLHVVDGELTDPALPIIPGHEIVGEVLAAGPEATRFSPGDRVGVPWLGWTCGACRYCATGRENLCDAARFTGYQIDGGYAELARADERFAFALPDDIDDAHAAPLLCAGLIGYRALRMAGDGQKLGFYGFGSAAHILCQVAVHDGKQGYAFTRPDDSEGRDFARKSGAVWAGGSDAMPPEQLDAAIIFAPVGDLVPAALKVVRKGGIVVCAGIHMSNIPEFPYEDLWEERVIRSVANLTRKDGEEFLKLAPEIPVKTEVAAYPLEKANEALDDLRNGRFSGSAAIVIRENS